MRAARQHPARRWSVSPIWAAGAVLVLLLPMTSAAQTAPRVNGRVVDSETGAPVADAVVTLVHRETPDSIRHSLVTNDLGLFRVERMRSGDYEMTVEHIAYGTFVERVTLVRGEDLALRVTLSTTAIVLDPVVVEAMRQETRASRARGTARRVVTWEELLPVAETGAHLGVAMSQLLPGVRLTSQRSAPGQHICLEFRNPATLQGGSCLPPLVFVDGVRQGSSIITLNTLPVTDIRRLEVLPPGEAGVQYGTDSQYGVVIIETFTGGEFLRRAPEGTGGGIYNWSLESRPYPWGRSLAWAAAANAAGLAAGYALSGSCLNFDNLTAHFTKPECGSLGNAAARTALYVAPQAVLGYFVQRMGRTDLSSGNMWKSTIASMIMAVPGVVLALTNEEDGFSGSKGLGVVMMTVGAPAAAVAADRLFRREHPQPLPPLR